MSWTHALWVGSGGFLGAVLRWGTGVLLARAAASLGLPIATLTVNVVGCFLFGALAGYSQTRELFSEEIRLFLLVGLLGGFTTYSALGFEAFSLLKAQDWTRFAIHVGLHLVLGIGAVAAGYALGAGRT